MDLAVRLASSSESDVRERGPAPANIDEPLAEYEWKGLTIERACTCVHARQGDRRQSTKGVKRQAAEQDIARRTRGHT